MLADIRAAGARNAFDGAQTAHQVSESPAGIWDGRDSGREIKRHLCEVSLVLRRYLRSGYEVVDAVAADFACTAQCARL
jgi:hypothetical protein